MLNDAVVKTNALRSHPIHNITGLHTTLHYVGRSESLLPPQGPGPPRRERRSSQAEVSWKGHEGCWRR